MPHKNPNSYRDVEGGDSAYQEKEARLRGQHRPKNPPYKPDTAASSRWAVAHGLPEDFYTVGPRGANSKYPAKAKYDALKARKRPASQTWEELKKDKYGVGPKGPKPTVRVLPAEKRHLQVTAAGGQYIIQRGDNLTKIAKRLGTTVDALSKKNNIRNPNIIRAGTKLHYGG